MNLTYNLMLEYDNWLLVGGGVVFLAHSVIMTVLTHSVRPPIVNVSTSWLLGLVRCCKLLVRFVQALITISIGSSTKLALHLSLSMHSVLCHSKTHSGPPEYSLATDTVCFCFFNSLSLCLCLSLSVYVLFSFVVHSLCTVHVSHMHKAKI